MSKIALKPSNSGTATFTIEAPATNTNRVLELPDEAGKILTDVGVPTSAMPAGSVLQVVQAVKTDFFTTSSTSFVDITGFSVSITPSSASNRILVISHIHAGNSATGQETRFLLRRDLNNIFLPTVGTARNQTLTTGNLGSTSNVQNMACTFLDSPNTTSAVTYSYQIAVTAGTARFNGRGDGEFSGNTSSITLMEIAA